MGEPRLQVCSVSLDMDSHKRIKNEALLLLVERCVFLFFFEFLGVFQTGTTVTLTNFFISFPARRKEISSAKLEKGSCFTHRLWFSRTLFGSPSNCQQSTWEKVCPHFSTFFGTLTKIQSQFRTIKTMVLWEYHLLRHLLLLSGALKHLVTW